MEPQRSSATLLVQSMDVRQGYVFETSDGRQKFIVTRVRAPHVEVVASKPGCGGNVGAHSITNLVYPAFVPGIADNPNPAHGGVGPDGIVAVLEQAAP